MKTLTITWQQLVDAAGVTWPRCAGTQQEMQHAMDRPRAALGPLAGPHPFLSTVHLKPLPC